MKVFCFFNVAQQLSRAVKGEIWKKKSKEIETIEGTPTLLRLKPRRKTLNLKPQGQANGHQTREDAFAN